eukprot:scaffold20330_cov46-Phaeocystis_antarctica.AAC.4
MMKTSWLSPRSACSPEALSRCQYMPQASSRACILLHCSLGQPRPDLTGQIGLAFDIASSVR